MKRATLHLLALILIVTARVTCASADEKPIAFKALGTPYAGSTIYVPNGGEKESRPGVLVLHGGKGGSDDRYRLIAQFLAANGYVAFAYCYFDCARDPRHPGETLSKLKIEKVGEALDWLKKSPYVAGKKIGIVGFSKGSELALLLSSRFPSGADALALHAPTDVTSAAVNWEWFNPRCYVESLFGAKKWNRACGNDDPKKFGPASAAWSIAGQDITPGTRIEVEKYPGPIYISHGTDDRTFEVERSRRIEAKLKLAGRPPTVHYFTGEDHYLSTSAEQTRLEEVVSFLRKYL